MDTKRPTQRHIITKTAKFKGKERILKPTGEKQVVTYKGAPIRLPSDFSTETFQAIRDLAWNIQGDEKQGPMSKATLPSKAII